jgi:hypothetical protein
MSSGDAKKGRSQMTVRRGMTLAEAVRNVGASKGVIQRS